MSPPILLGHGEGHISDNLEGGEEAAMWLSGEERSEKQASSMPWKGDWSVQGSAQGLCGPLPWVE